MRVAFVVAVLVAATAGTARAAVLRPPSGAELRTMTRQVESTWLYESRLRYARPRSAGVHPVIVRALVLARDPRYRVGVVELRDARGRPRRRPAVALFDRYGVERVGVVFANACTRATPRVLRVLVCPDPWRLLGYPRPHVRVQRSLRQRVDASAIRAVDWRRVALPGATCGSSRAIRLASGTAFVRPDVENAWWSRVLVSSGRQPVYGDLDGDGHDEAALDFVCANDGGTAAGQLVFGVVVFALHGHVLQTVGIAGSQEPVRVDAAHVPVLRAEAIEAQRLVVGESWYGPYDGTCCGTGRVRTEWVVRNGTLRVRRTIVLRHRWMSAIAPPDVVVNGSDLTTTLPPGPLDRLEVRLDSLHPRPVGGLRVTVALRQGATRTVRTFTAARFAAVDGWVGPTVVVEQFGRLRPGGTALLTVRLHTRGAFPLHYRFRVAG